MKFVRNIPDFNIVSKFEDFIAKPKVQALGLSQFLGIFGAAGVDAMFVKRSVDLTAGSIGAAYVLAVWFALGAGVIAKRTDQPKAVVVGIATGAALWCGAQGISSLMETQKAETDNGYQHKQVQLFENTAGLPKVTLGH